jgi:hypothetical protein
MSRLAAAILALPLAAAALPGDGLEPQIREAHYLGLTNLVRPNANGARHQSYVWPSEQVGPSQWRTWFAGYYVTYEPWSDSAIDYVTTAGRADAPPVQVEHYQVVSDDPLAGLDVAAIRRDLDGLDAQLASSRLQARSLSIRARGSQWEPLADASVAQIEAAQRRADALRDRLLPSDSQIPSPPN